MAVNDNIDLCLVLANHWSFVGIGWQCGIESCAQSIADSLAVADATPSLKTSINLDAGAYEFVKQHYPLLIERLRDYIERGLVEIVGATYGQPMGSMVSGESNLRQMVFGQEAMVRTLGKRVVVFLEEEEMTHPQIPQLAKQAGYKYASLAQCDTWGRHGTPKVECNVIEWQGVDGTSILSTPSNKMVFHPPVVTHDIDSLWSEPGQALVRTMRANDQPPLAVRWTEFGWEDLSEQGINKFDHALFTKLSDAYRVEYLTLEQYLDRYGKANAKSVQFSMDQFKKLLPWGIGGDQIRRFGREVEALLLTAERFDAAAHLLGLESAPPERLYSAWQELLVSQSHDVSLCEFSRFQGKKGAYPRQPIFDFHFQPWGAGGWKAMDKAKQIGDETLAGATRVIAGRVGIRSDEKTLASIVAFNGSAFDRDGTVVTETIYFDDRKPANLSIARANGTEIATQLLSADRNAQGQLLSTKVAFSAKALPAIGYEAFSVKESKQETAVATGLRIDPSALRLENEFVSVTLDPKTGAIASLIDRNSGRNFIEGSQRAFPTLTGKTNRSYIPQRLLSAVIEESLDSSKSQAQFQWVERGPVRATLKVTHPEVSRTMLQTFITLEANSPSVQVHARLYLDVPPEAPDGKVNGWQFELEINDGYWFEFTPAFKPTEIIRDYPFGIEPCGKDVIDALTFLDLLGDDGSGLMIVHSGNQYFKRLDNGVIGNLIVREWESHFTGECGFARVGDHRYTLTPHAGELTNHDRLRLSAEMDFKPHCVTLKPGNNGTLPPAQSLMAVKGGGIVSSMRRRPDGAAELRLVDCEGRATNATITTPLPISRVRLTNALGDSAGEWKPIKNPMPLRPWEIKTLECER